MDTCVDYVQAPEHTFAFACNRIRKVDVHANLKDHNATFA